MLISDLIRELQEIQRTQGDMALVTWGYMGASRVDDIAPYIKVIKWTERRKGQTSADGYTALCIHAEPNPGRG